MKTGYIKTNVITNTITMAYRNLLKTLHNPERLFDVLIQPIITMIMFGYLFGGAIAGSVKDYLPIIVPGVLMQALLSAATNSGAQIREDLDSGVFDRFKSLPIASIAPLAGQLFADVLRLIIATVASLVTGYIMGWHPEAGLFWVIMFSLLSIFIGWAISWIFALLGIITGNATTLQSFSMLFMLILSFLSSSFVPIKTLPNWLQVLANVNPITHIITASRQMLDHGVWGNEAWMVLGIGVLIVIIFAPLTVFVYNKHN